MKKIYEEDRGNSGNRRHKEGYCLACRIRGGFACQYIRPCTFTI